MTFDAFYAASVHRVTSQVHAQSQDDPLSDHAIREAYARAYQQWYEVSTYPDPEAWVLQAATDAYERRRAETGSTGLPSGPSASADSGTWPGIYRPRDAADTMDPEATIAPARPASTQPWRPGAGAASAAPQALFGPDSADGPQGGPPPLADTAQVQGGGLAWGGGRAAGRRPGFGAQAPLRRGKSSRGFVVAIVAVVVIAIATVGYVAFGRGLSSNSAGQNPGTGVNGGQGSQMLPAGGTGSRTAVPWQVVGPGWTLAELSTAPPASNGSSGAGGQAIFYLVDPLGGKYRMHTWPGSAAPTLLSWSGDKMNALYATKSGYGLLHLPTGTATQLALPPDVVPAGFTRPDGENVLAVREHGNRFQLQRYDLNGTFQATLGNLPRRQTAPAWQACGMLCGALNSPDGISDVWGVSGEEMRLVSNARGLLRKLPVPDSGKPPSCSPISWWDAHTILATCAVFGQPDPNSQRLWLVPDSGDSPRALSAPSGNASGAGFDLGAWQAGSGVYITQTTARQCAGAASGPGGLDVARLSPDESQVPLTIAGTTNNHNSIVAAVGSKLLVLAQVSCPGSSTLLWYEPSSGATTMLLKSRSDQAGVIVAVPYGAGPTAMSVG